MNIWNKVFLVLIFLLALGVVFFAGQEYKVRSAGQQKIASLEKDQIKAEEEIEKILQGSAPDKPQAEKSFEEMGLEESRLKLFDLLYERKKAWFGCKPGNINPQGKVITPEQLGGNLPATPGDQLKPAHLLEAKVTITGPLIEQDGNEVVMPPDDLTGIVYVFDEGQEGVNGSFLGVFTVSAPAQKVNNAYQVTLHSANEMNEAEVQRIQKAGRSTWAIYATIPTDRFDGVFNRLSEEAIETLIPAAVRKELTNSERPLKDFGELLTRRYQRRVELQQEIDSTKKDIAMLNTSLELVRAESEKLRENIEFEKKRIAAMGTQRQALEDMLKKYDDTIQQLRDDIDKTQKQNVWYEEKIAEYQLKVRNLIEQKAERAAIE